MCLYFKVCSGMILWNFEGNMWFHRICPGKEANQNIKARLNSPKIFNKNIKNRNKSSLFIKWQSFVTFFTFTYNETPIHVSTVFKNLNKCYFVKITTLHLPMDQRFQYWMNIFLWKLLHWTTLSCINTINIK